MRSGLPACSGRLRSGLGCVHWVGGARHLVRIHWPQVRRCTHWWLLYRIPSILHRPADKYSFRGGMHPSKAAIPAGCSMAHYPANSHLLPCWCLCRCECRIMSMKQPCPQFAIQQCRLHGFPRAIRSEKPHLSAGACWCQGALAAFSSKGGVSLPRRCPAGPG